MKSILLCLGKAGMELLQPLVTLIGTVLLIGALGAEHNHDEAYGTVPS